MCEKPESVEFKDADPSVGLEGLASYSAGFRTAVVMCITQRSTVVESTSSAFQALDFLPMMSKNSFQERQAFNPAASPRHPA